MNDNSQNTADRSDEECRLKLAGAPPLVQGNRPRRVPPAAILTTVTGSIPMKLAMLWTGLSFSVLAWLWLKPPGNELPAAAGVGVIVNCLLALGCTVLAARHGLSLCGRLRNDLLAWGVVAGKRERREKKHDPNAAHPDFRRDYVTWLVTFAYLDEAGGLQRASYEVGHGGAITDEAHELLLVNPADPGDIVPADEFPGGAVLRSDGTIRVSAGATITGLLPPLLAALAVALSILATLWLAGRDA